MKVWKKRYTQVDVARYYEQKANRPGSTGTFYFILRSRAIRACHQAAEAATAAGRRKTDLGKSTLLFRFQPKGGTIGLPLIRNSRWLAARRFCSSEIAKRFPFFLYFRRFPRLSRINGGGSREGKSAGWLLNALYSNEGRERGGTAGFLEHSHL